MAGLIMDRLLSAKGLLRGLLIAAASLAAAVLLLLGFSSSFSTALGLFFLGPFKNLYYFGNMLNAAVVLILAGLAASLAFTSRNFNLGGEGQIYLGAIASVAVGLALRDTDPLLATAASCAAGAFVGGLLGWLSGFLKRWAGVDELISSFLLSSAMVYLGDYLITSPLQDRASSFQTTEALPAVFRFAKLLPPSSLSTGAFVALAALLLAHVLLSRSRFGYELRLTGLNGEFARYNGIDTGAYASGAMALSGAMNGLAGAVLVFGLYFKAYKGFSAGLGWSGIAVTLLAGNHPLAILPSALFFAYLDAGAKAVMIGSDVASEILSVIQSVIFFLVTARAFDSLFTNKRRGRKGASGGGGADGVAGAVPTKGECP